MTLIAAGLALTTSPATDAIMGAVPPGKAGAGSLVAAAGTAAAAAAALAFLPARAKAPRPGQPGRLRGDLRRKPCGCPRERAK